jgi:transposase
MVLLRESGMTQPAIAQAMGVSVSTVNRAHMSYDGGGIKSLNSLMGFSPVRWVWTACR